MVTFKKLTDFIRSRWQRFIQRWQGQRWGRVTSLVPRAERGQGWGGMPWWGWGVDTVDRGDAYVLRYRLPLSSDSDFSVAVVGDTLVLRGSASRQCEERGRGYYRFAAVSGSVYRSMPLPPEVDSSRIEAFSRNREVEIRLPKRGMTTATVRRVPVRAG
ncbi:MAG: Hsp20/alpha crystallin family protein [Abditibacteriales bacterium]|nr:Hsp20/alpha crystallin family protein [Abditibacteriales bacterium]MDW8365534.1 Hsp20/alpha crystallin family protein [Abditibacteriales bacterium]